MALSNQAKIALQRALANTGAFAEFKALLDQTAGTAAANEFLQLGANKDVDTLRVETSFGLGGAPVAQQAAMTAQLTTVTHSEPGTPDYAIQDLTQSSPFGFVTADEGQSVLKVIANLQARVAEIEAILVAFGFAAAE